MARIAIVGSGVVGQATGKGFGQLGHEVVFADVKDDVLARLRAEGHSAIHVHHLPEYPASAIVLSLPTPTEHGRLQLKYLESALEMVANCIAASEDYKLVVVRCTVPPGTTEELIIPRLERASGKAVGRQFGVSHNPEFLRAVSSEQDFLEPWLMVFGSHDDRSGRELEELYGPILARNHIPVVRTDLRTAEMAKYASNLYNAAKISFTNEIWSACRRLGIDGDEVMAIASQSAEGMWNPRYGTRGGYPYGGACLPKDTTAFLAFAAETGIPMPLLAAVVEVNERIAAGNGNADADDAVPAYMAAAAGGGGGAGG